VIFFSALILCLWDLFSSGFDLLNGVSAVCRYLLLCFLLFFPLGSSNPSFSLLSRLHAFSFLKLSVLSCLLFVWGLGAALLLQLGGELLLLLLLRIGSCFLILVTELCCVFHFHRSRAKCVTSSSYLVAYLFLLFFTVTCCFPPTSMIYGVSFSFAWVAGVVPLVLCVRRVVVKYPSLLFFSFLYGLSSDRSTCVGRPSSFGEEGGFYRKMCILPIYLLCRIRAKTRLLAGWLAGWMDGWMAVIVVGRCVRAQSGSRRDGPIHRSGFHGDGETGLCPDIYIRSLAGGGGATSKQSQSWGKK